MAIDAKMVKDLRAQTGAGILDCRKALVETDGDMAKAADWLRTKGIAKAAKKAGRAATEGSVYAYIHAGGKLGVLLEVNCETDFVARGDDFQGFCKDVAMHIAAAGPRYVKEDEIPADVLESERRIFIQQAVESGKPEAIAEKMVEGKLKKFRKEICLLDQPFVKDEDKTIGALLTEFVAKCGENVQIRRFVRWQLGEGLEKKVDNFVEEVARMAGGN